MCLSTQGLKPVSLALLTTPGRSKVRATSGTFCAYDDVTCVIFYLNRWSPDNKISQPPQETGIVLTVQTEHKRGQRCKQKTWKCRTSRVGFSIPLKFMDRFLCQKPRFTSQTVKSNQNLAGFSFFCMHVGYFMRWFSCPVLHHWESPG